MSLAATLRVRAKFVSLMLVLALVLPMWAAAAASTDPSALLARDTLKSLCLGGELGGAPAMDHGHADCCVLCQTSLPVADVQPGNIVPVRFAVQSGGVVLHVPSPTTRPDFLISTISLRGPPALS